MPRDNVADRLDELRAEAPLVLSPGAPLDSARELVRRHHMDADHRTLHHLQGTFYRWAKSHYTESAHEIIRAATWEFLDGALREENRKLVPFAPTKSKVGNVIEALAAVAQLPDGTHAPAWIVPRPELDSTSILSCANGLLHLPTRTLLDHTPSFFALKAVSFPFQPSAPEPEQWLAFLRSIWPDDTASVETLQELFGLLLTADTSQQKSFLLVGPKRSGKGTIARVLTALLGRDNVAGPTLSSLTQNFGLAPLIGKPLAIISDARLGGRADLSVVVERLLAITGEDGITVDRKFRDSWTGRLPTRFLILTNELPRLTDASGALAGRFILLCLATSFYGREDPALTSKLLSELPGILNWSLVGYDRLMKRGHFIQPASGEQALQELEDLASPISAFLRDRCLLGQGHGVETTALFNAWLAWCREQNREHVGTVQAFGRDLRAAVPAVRITQPRASDGSRSRYYEGVTLDPSK